MPLPARPLDPAADQLGQSELYRCAFFEGFSLHANVDVAAHDRDGLLRLVRYGARQAIPVLAPLRGAPAPVPARLDPQLELEWDPTDDGHELALDVEAQPRGPP